MSEERKSFGEWVEGSPQLQDFIREGVGGRAPVTDEELEQWAKVRADDAGHLARELIGYRRAAPPAPVGGAAVCTCGGGALSGSHSRTCAAFDESMMRYDPFANMQPVAINEGGSEYGDAYQGAREDLSIWKRRALEAEELNRKFMREINGPTFMGEPVGASPVLTNAEVIQQAKAAGFGFDEDDIPLYGGIDNYRRLLAASSATATPQPSAKALTDEQILSICKDFFAKCYVDATPSDWIGLARALLAAEQSSEDKRDAFEAMRDALADFIADNWSMRKYTLTEIESGIRAIGGAITKGA